MFLLIVVLGGTLFSGCTKKGDEIDVEGLIKELSGNVEEQMLSRIQYTPTVLFVDSKGVLLSDAVVGGFETKEEFDRFYKKRLNELLVGLGKEKAFEEPQD